MQCRHIAILAQRYHDGDLDAAERARYEKHLAECEACRDLDARYAAVFGALASLPLPDPPPGFDTRIMERVKVSRYRAGPARRFGAAMRAGWELLPRPLRVAAGLVAVFGLFTAVYTPLLGMLAEAAGKAVDFAGSGMFIMRRVIEDPSLAGRYLETATNYRLAGRILVQALTRQASGIGVPYAGLAALAALAVLVVVARATRARFSKGESHVGII